MDRICMDRAALALLMTGRNASGSLWRDGFACPCVFVGAAAWRSLPPKQSLSEIN